MLESASVEGERFHAGALRAGRDSNYPEVLGCLNRLMQRELIRPDRADIEGEDRFRFAHALIRDAAYSRISKTDRAVLHEGVAGSLGQHDASEEVIGYHLEQAHLVGREVGPPNDRVLAIARHASELLELAGRRAHDRADLGATANLIQRAVDLRPMDDPRRLGLLPLLGDVVADIDLPKAEPILTEAITNAHVAGEPRIEWEARVILSRVLLYLDPTARALDEVFSDTNRAIEELTALGADWALASALMLRFDIEWMQGKLSGVPLLAPALDTTSTSITLRANAYIGGGLAYGPEPAADAERECRRLFDRAAGNRAAQATVLDSLGFLEAMQGRISQGRRSAQHGRDTLAELGQEEWTAITTLTCGYVELLDDKLEAAEREFARAGVSI